MSYQVLAPEAQPCVWMCAGLISYRLCDRGFACETCPLDGALRGQLRATTASQTPLDRRADEGMFPEDRLYSPGHSWVQALSLEDGRRWRVGLDAFATALVGCAIGVRWGPLRKAFQRGDRLCEVDLGLGSIGLAAPISGRLARGNRVLEARPETLVTDPYGDGWILEMEGLDPGGILGLRSAGRAREQSGQDLRRFRRSLALRLLTESGEDPRPAATPEGSPRDLRQVLCGHHYVELLEQFIH